MQCACAILSSVARSAPPYFSTLSHKGHDFLKEKMLLNIRCVFWFCLQLSSEIFLILGGIRRDIIIKCVGHHVKYPLFLSDCNETWISSIDLRKIAIYQILWKSAQREPSCSVLTDRQTDMAKLTVAFRNFANAPKNKFQIRQDDKLQWI